MISDDSSGAFPLSTLIIKTAVSEEGFVYVLQENNRMVVYEAVDYYKTIYLNHKIVRRWEQAFAELPKGG